MINHYLIWYACFLIVWVECLSYLLPLHLNCSLTIQKIAIFMV